MTDVFTNKKRSEVMSSIRSHGNKSTEIAMIEFFRNNNFTGWRRHKKIFGNPDFVFPKIRLAVFVDGCFWHGCSQHYNAPKNNRVFWENKIDSNKKRDKVVTKTLKQQGWGVLRIWEHELQTKYSINLKKRFNNLL